MYKKTSGQEKSVAEIVDCIWKYQRYLLLCHSGEIVSFFLRWTSCAIGGLNKSIVRVLKTLSANTHLLLPFLVSHFCCLMGHSGGISFMVRPAAPAPGPLTPTEVCDVLQSSSQGIYCLSHSRLSSLLSHQSKNSTGMRRAEFGCRLWQERLKTLPHCGYQSC